MGKTSKARKNKKKDFQKVKFKIGKSLPKNLNETRATFKAKSLILKQQFTLEKEGPTSHRNLTWRVNKP
jgi:pre-rRNA-processing protein IPI1